MAYLKIFASVALLYVLWTAFRLHRNYARARLAGFKLRIVPFDNSNILTSIVFGPLLPVLRRVLPASAFRTIDLVVYGVEWRDRVVRQERDTPGYMLVNTTNILDLFIEDTELAAQILARRRDFEQDSTTQQIMNNYGPSLAGSTGNAWARQRRIIAPMVNERIMETVWDESRQQANDMMSHFMTNCGGVTDSTVIGLRRIAFNVLQCIGYGMPGHWGATAKEPPKGHTMDYMDALHHLIEGLLVLTIMPPWLLTKSWMPKALNDMGKAYFEFFNYSSELLKEERVAGANSAEPRNNFLSILANINDDSLDVVEKDARSQKPALTEQEITGNLYQFTLAGYDTTANTMAYAFAMLASLPEWQEWIFEEIDHVHKTVHDPLNYKEVFPKLERCLALMVS